MRRLGAIVLAAVAFTAVSAAAAQTVPDNVDPATVAIAPVSDPDPAGGPPWGLRTFGTTDGANCAQVGRLQDGKLGSVDANGTFTESPARANGCGGPARPGAALGPGLWGMARYETAAGVRSVFFGRLGPLLKRVTFADPDGKNPRDLQVSPNGEYVAVYPDSVRMDNEPRQRFAFDGGCGPERKQLLGLSPTAEIVNCQVVVTFGGSSVQRESAASKRARKHPSRPSPVTVTPEVAGPGRRITVHFKVPITLQPGDAYVVRLTGEGAKKCADKLDLRRDVAAASNFRTSVRGRWDDILLPLGGKTGRWCRGTYNAEVSFRTGGKVYKPFGSATFRIK